MDSTAQPLVDTYRLRLDSLIRKGRALRDQAAADRSQSSTIAAVRIWQNDCAETVNELSGGSKAHWLARAFSEAFLVRSIASEAVPEAPLAEIVNRIVAALEQARGTLTQVDADPRSSPTAPRPRRFDFVHNQALRPVLEQAATDAQTAFDQQQFAVALMTTCGVLESVITDALEHAGMDTKEWTFQMRIEAAERAGLIRSGCARLPPIAREYRERVDASGSLASEQVSARDARVAGQVLQVVIRDLDPGR